MADKHSQADGQLPEQDGIQPEDSVSNVSGATTSASKTPSLKSRLRYAKRNAELRAFKKKMEMELTLADLDVEDQKARAQAEAARAQAEAARAQADVEKAERDRRRRRAELVIQQATLESELEIAQARHDIDEAVTDKKSATSRVRWQDIRENQTNERSLTLHNALQPTARPFVPAVNVSNHAHFNVPHTSRTDYPDLSAIVSPLITTTATSHPAFFDDRDHLITGLGVDNTERGRFASTSLPHMVTDLSNTVYMSPVTNTSHPENLCPPPLDQTQQNPLTRLL